MSFDVCNAMTYLIDTAKAIRRIEATGLAPEQAEAIVETFAATSETVATKADVDSSHNELKTYIDQVRNELKAEIDRVYNELKVRLDGIDDKIEAATYKQRVWLVSVQAVFTALVIATLTIIL